MKQKRHPRRQKLSTVGREEKRTRRVLSVRSIVTGTAVALISAAVIGAAGVAEYNARAALNRESSARLLLEARNLALVASTALLNEYPELTLAPVVKNMKSDRSEITLVVVVDHLGNIRGHEDTRQLGTAFQSLSGGIASDSAPDLEAGETLQRFADQLVASVDVSHANGKPLGKVLVAIQTSYVDNLITQSRRHQLAFFFILLSIGVALTMIIMSSLTRPIKTLRAGLEKIGRGDLTTRLQMSGRTDLGQLGEHINDMTARLESATREMLDKERMAHELALAQRIQRSLLPSERTQTGNFVIQGAQVAAAEVGGDFYDVFELDNGRVGVVVADVAGKGLAGCMVTSMLAVLIRSMRHTSLSPKELLIALEHRLCEFLEPGVFITMFYGILDPQTGVLTYASAGHCPLLVYRASSQEIELHQTKGIPIGAVRKNVLGRTLTNFTLSTDPGDVVVQYTDGMYESWNADQECFGMERLAEVVGEVAGQGPGTLIQQLFARLSAWVGSRQLNDDGTVLVLSHDRLRSRSNHTQSSKDAVNARHELEEMLRADSHFGLKTELSDLSRLRAWLTSTPTLTALPARKLNAVESGLYEYCANIIEHGHDKDPSHRIDLWWVSCSSGLAPEDPAWSDPQAATSRLHEGYFLILDQAPPFNVRNRRSSLLAAEESSATGRGLGLRLLNKAMQLVSYHAETSAGNVTFLRFNPESQSQKAEEETWVRI